MSADKHLPENESLQKELCVSPDRRELLDKLGKLAAYTPPVLLGLMLSSRPSAASTAPVACGTFPLNLPCDAPKKP